MKCAPVAMFVYNRADNTRQTLDALLANTLASETELYVFSDGGRDGDSWALVNQVREVLHEVKDRAENRQALKKMTIVERPENFYLERNIMEGIAQVLEQHEEVIVLEDDIVTSPYFLQYMNEAFSLYADEPRVMHISGFTNLSLPQGVEERDFYFTPHMAGWGWGTWRNRWQQHFKHFGSKEEALEGLTQEDIDTIQYGGVFPCLNTLDKNPIPWDACWELAIYRAQGLCLSPAQTMVQNIGLKQGTHFQSWDALQYYEYDREPLQRPLALERVDNPAPNEETERLFVEAIKDWGIRYTALGKMVRWIYKKVKR